MSTTVQDGNLSCVTFVCTMIRAASCSMTLSNEVFNVPAGDSNGWSRGWAFFITRRTYRFGLTRLHPLKRYSMFRNSWRACPIYKEQSHSVSTSPGGYVELYGARFS